MKRLVSLATVLALTALGLAAPADAGAGARPPQQTPRGAHGHGYQPPPIEWKGCELFPGFEAECGMLTVPLDYRRPHGRTIRLAVSRVVHTVPHSQYQGVMLVNPGGPGGSGLTLAILGLFVPNDAGAAYDWIGFDPRGVGQSKPSLSCDGHYTDYGRPPYVPRKRSIEKAWLRRAQGYAHDCAKAGGALLDHLKTTDNVADMESLRKALGRQRINFYGYSYGTYLGQVYSTLHPDRVRRMVLDSNVNPERVWYDANIDQDIAFQKTFNAYLAWLADHDATYGLGDTGRQVKRLYHRVHRQLDKHPAGGLFSGNELDDVFLDPAYGVFDWALVAEAFAAWVHDRDISGLRNIWENLYPTGPGTDNLNAIYLSTICTDTSWPQSWQVWRRDMWRTHARAPFFTWANAWLNAPCRDWAGDVGHPVRIKRNTFTKHILLIGETRDPATPFEGNLVVRSRYPGASLIEGVGGTTHAASLNGVSCVDDRIAAYLTDGSVPPRKPGRRSDLRCEPLPPPSPGAARLGERSAGMPQTLRDALRSPLVR